MPRQFREDGQWTDPSAAQGAHRHVCRLTGRERRAAIARLIVIAGPSGCGKGTIIGCLLRRVPGLVVSVSATTRARRRGEVDGCDYFFLSETQFDEWVERDLFLEWAAFSDHRYGTPARAVQEQLDSGCDVLLEIEIEGASQIRDKRPDAVLVFIMPPSLDELERRLRGRGTEKEDAIARRLARAAQEMEIIRSGAWENSCRFDYVIVNDSLEQAVEELVQVIEQAREEDEQTYSR